MASTTHARAPLTDEPPQDLPVDFPSDPPPALGVILLLACAIALSSAIACAAGAGFLYLLEH